jgi:hypothetical protein
MSNRKLQSIGVLAFIGCLTVFPATTIQAADKLGKICIKAGSPEPGGFVDRGLEDTVKDLKKRAGSFVVVDDEASADFLMLVVGRDDTPMSGQATAKRVTVNLSIRDGASWKPGVKISKVTTSWGLSAAHVIGDAKKWIEANVRK